MLDLGLLNQFLRLIVLNHQDTVKQLSEKPEEKNPTRSFHTYLPHLRLLKKMSELIWDKPDWYSMESIVQSKVMKGLWMFISYCEAYYEDCELVKRCHLNLLLIIEIFQNIINSSGKDKHKMNFRTQRQSMLPQGGETSSLASRTNGGGAKSQTGSSCMGEPYNYMAPSE